MAWKCGGDAVEGGGERRRRSSLRFCLSLRPAPPENEGKSPPPHAPPAHPLQYLLNFLGDVPDAPNLADPAFQQLLVDVQSVKVCLPPRAAPLTATLHRAQ